VKNAYQALAIDEKRNEFPPTLWTGAAQPGQIVEQVWFAGVHSDVGGGYPETGLSDITLSWMLSKAIALGMDVDPEAVKPYLPLPVDPQKAIAELHDSWNPLWGLWHHRTIDPASTISNSVQVRVAEMSGYRPSNLHLGVGQLDETYPIEDVVANPGMAVAASS